MRVFASSHRGWKYCLVVNLSLYSQYGGCIKSFNKKLCRGLDWIVLFQSSYICFQVPKEMYFRPMSIVEWKYRHLFQKPSAGLDVFPYKMIRCVPFWLTNVPYTKKSLILAHDTIGLNRMPYVQSKINIQSDTSIDIVNKNWINAWELLNLWDY